MELIESTPNPFGGTVINLDGLSGNPDEFKKQLHPSINAWKNEGFKVAWLEVPVAKAALIPVALEAGFSFHHAEQNYVLLTCQLVERAYIPPYATHYIGAGGVVVNEAREILVVSERYRRRSRGPAYKLPGGALHPGEHLEGGVIREVFEETGVRTRFESVVCFRHWHGYRYGKSDLYFVCRLSPLSREISMQTDEIEQCLWMPVDEYLGAEDVSSFNKHIVRAALETPGIVPTMMDGYADEEKYEFFYPDGSIFRRGGSVV